MYAPITYAEAFATALAVGMILALVFGAVYLAVMETRIYLTRRSIGHNGRLAPRRVAIRRLARGW